MTECLWKLSRSLRTPKNSAKNSEETRGFVLGQICAPSSYNKHGIFHSHISDKKAEYMQDCQLTVNAKLLLMHDASNFVNFGKPWNYLRS